MFQVFTLDSWSEVIARPIFNANAAGPYDFGHLPRTCPSSSESPSSSCALAQVLCGHAKSKS